MTYPASPGDAGTSRVRLDAAQYWAGAVATAVVAALIALVGILISRWTLGIPILAPVGDGAWGNAHTAEYVLVSALVAIIAAGLLYLLILAAPQPLVFFHWIVGLATLAAVVYPFSSSATINQKGATAVVNLVLGLAITSLLTAVAARAARRIRPRLPYDEGSHYVPDERYGPEGQYRPEQRYGPEQDPAYRREYPPPQQQDQIRTRPMRPANAPQNREPRRGQ